MPPSDDRSSPNKRQDETATDRLYREMTNAAIDVALRHPVPHPQWIALRGRLRDLGLIDTTTSPATPCASPERARLDAEGTSVPKTRLVARVPSDPDGPTKTLVMPPANEYVGEDGARVVLGPGDAQPEPDCAGMPVSCWHRRTAMRAEIERLFAVPRSEVAKPCDERNPETGTTCMVGAAPHRVHSDGFRTWGSPGPIPPHEPRTAEAPTCGCPNEYHDVICPLGLRGPRPESDRRGRNEASSDPYFTPEFYANQVAAARAHGESWNLDEAEVIAFLAANGIDRRWGTGQVASLLTELLHRTRLDERRRERDRKDGPSIEGGTGERASSVDTAKDEEHGPPGAVQPLAGGAHLDGSSASSQGVGLSPERASLEGLDPGDAMALDSFGKSLIEKLPMTNTQAWDMVIADHLHAAFSRGRVAGSEEERIATHRLSNAKPAALETMAAAVDVDGPLPTGMLAASDEWRDPAVLFAEAAEEVEGIGESGMTVILANGTTAVMTLRPKAADDADAPLHVCTRCNDTHRMPSSGFMCTGCPRPCEECRSRGPGRAGGPFCASTPCGCVCHSDSEQYRRVHRETLRRARSAADDACEDIRVHTVDAGLAALKAYAGPARLTRLDCVEAHLRSVLEEIEEAKAEGTR